MGIIEKITQLKQIDINLQELFDNPKQMAYALTLRKLTGKYGYLSRKSSYFFPTF